MMLGSEMQAATALTDAERTRWAALSARCAVFGWALLRDSGGLWHQWRLEGNSAPAWFRSLDGLEDWLHHQEQRKQWTHTTRNPGTQAPLWEDL